MSDSIPRSNSGLTVASVREAESIAEMAPPVSGARVESRSRDSADDSILRDLKGKTARAALVATCGQGANFFLRIGSMVVLARLLAPADFGLVGMATACTGFLELFRDAGLSMATIQRASISHAQISTLFWLNLAVGGLLAALCAITAPLVVVFYHEPRLLWVTVVLGMSFICSGAAAQHRAILQRHMRFAVLTTIDIVSLLAGIALGVGMALAGKGYWALVGLPVCQSIVGVLGVWMADRWIPGLPRRGVGLQSMLRYGGTVTLNSVIVYIAYNADKVLLGRFWGAETLGIYGRAYQFINLPTTLLNTTVGQVAFPALSRLQNDPERLKSYFLKGYSLFLSLVMPITMACALFSDDIIMVILGPKWSQAAPVFRWLAPTIVAFALINPFGWFMLATGRATRSLKIALLIAPVVILGYLAGLSHGSTGVALGFSVAMILLVVPAIWWARRGTPINAGDILGAVMRPSVSILIGTGATAILWVFIHSLNSPLIRLIAANAVLFGIYAIVLWFFMGQKAVYLGLLRDIGILPFAGRRRTREG